MQYDVRKTTYNDLNDVLLIYQRAREFMKANGNPTQWGDDWPSKEKIIEDIEKEISYVVVNNDEIIGVFAFVIGVDKTYINMVEGKWLSDKKYGTIHRLASSFKYKGVFSFAQKYLEDHFNCNFRIDTHADNKPMITSILKNGYVYCGIITPIEGGLRNAYEKVR